MKISQLANYCIDYIWKKKYNLDIINHNQIKKFNNNPDLMYSIHNIKLIIENDIYIQKLLSNVNNITVKQLYTEIEKILRAREEQLFQKNKLKLRNPFDNLKELIKEKSWDEAKYIITKLMPASFLMKENEIPSDEHAEHNFQRLYNVTYSSYGTYLDTNFIKETSLFYNESNEKVLKRFSEIKIHKNYLSSNTLKRQSDYIETQLFKTFMNKKLKKLPKEIRVYRGTLNPHAIIKQGDYVTPDKDLARDYIRGNFGIILEKTILIEDLIISKMPFGFESIELVYYPSILEKIVKIKGRNFFMKYPTYTFKEFYQKAQK